MASENLAAPTAAAVVVGSGVVNSLKSQASLLNSTLPDMFAGNFTLYLSDLTTIAGLAIGVISIVVTVIRLRRGK